MMKNLLILGAGGHGHVVAECAAEKYVDLHIAFLDDDVSNKGNLWPIVGSMGDLRRSEIRGAFNYAFCGLGANGLRRDWFRRIAEAGYLTPTLIHPTAYVSKSAQVGPGSLVCANAYIGPRTVIGAGVIVNTGSSVDHDCIVRDHVHISPGACIAGGVSVGDCTWVGIGAAIIDKIKIGRGAMVGAGAVVVREISDGATALGVPAKERHR